MPSSFETPIRGTSFNLSYYYCYSLLETQTMQVEHKRAGCCAGVARVSLRRSYDEGPSTAWRRYGASQLQCSSSAHAAYRPIPTDGGHVGRETRSDPNRKHARGDPKPTAIREERQRSDLPVRPDLSQGEGYDARARQLRMRELPQQRSVPHPEVKLSSCCFDND